MTTKTYLPKKIEQNGHVLVKKENETTFMNKSLKFKAIFYTYLPKHPIRRNIGVGRKIGIWNIKTPKIIPQESLWVMTSGNVSSWVEQLRVAVSGMFMGNIVTCPPLGSAPSWTVGALVRWMHLLYVTASFIAEGALAALIHETGSIYERLPSRTMTLAAWPLLL